MKNWGRLHSLKACHGYQIKKQVSGHAVAASIPLVISNFSLFPMLILRKSLLCPAGYNIHLRIFLRSICRKFIYTREVLLPLSIGSRKMQLKTTVTVC